MKRKPMKLQFYMKTDCPLCDDAKGVLQRVEVKTSFIAIEEIDITENLGVFTKYKHLIPVLELDGHRLFAHRATYRRLTWQLRWHYVRKLFAKFAN